MVSSALNITLEDLIEVLRRIRREHTKESEYAEWRANFPKGWPM